MQKPGDIPGGACAAATPDLLTVLQNETIASFLFPEGNGRKALARLKVSADTLLAIGRDDTCPNRVRFAAFEGWVASAGANVLGAADDATATAMARVQAQAIRDAEDAGLWGLPPRVTSSAVSRHLIRLRGRALPALRSLLDDTKALPYAGSESATIASLRNYRVNDLAAALIATIVGQPYNDAETPQERDRQINELRHE